MARILSRVFPLQITKRVYILVVIPFVAAIIFFILMNLQSHLKLVKAERGKILYSTARHLERKLPASFEDILKQNDALNKPLDEQVKVLNSVLQPVIDRFCAVQPEISMGYYSIEHDHILAVGPNYKPSYLRPIPQQYPYFNVNNTGEPELAYYDNFLVRTGKPVLLQTYPIYRNGKMIGHTWANIKMEVVYAAALAESWKIMAIGVAVIGSVFFLLWFIFKGFKKDLGNFAYAVARDIHELPEGVLPELNPILETVNKRTKELMRLNEQLQKEILDRKQAEQDQRESEERFRSAFDNAAIGMALVSLEHRFVEVNRALCDILGYPDQELLSKTFNEITHPDDIIADMNYVNRLLKGEIITYQMEKRYLHKLGHWVWIMLSVSLIRDAEGHPLYFISQIQDIDERKRAQEKIKLNEMRLETLLRLNQMTGQTLKEISHFVLDEMVRLTDSQIGWLGLLDEDQLTVTIHAWSKLSLMECAVTEKTKCFSTDTGGLWAEAVRQRHPVIINDYSAPHPMKKGYPPGHVHLSRIMGIPVIDGGRVSLIALVGNKKTNYDESDVLQLSLLMGGLWEIIQRKKAEDALQASEERFSTAFKSNPSIMSIVSFPGLNYIDVNDSWVSYFGCSREEVIARPLNEFPFWSELKDIPQHEEVLLESGRFKNREVVIKTKKGDIRYGLASAEIIELNGEKCMLFVINDITALKKLEKEMAGLDRLSLVGQMAAGIGHEIRNPMTTVRGFLQMLRGKQECSHYRDYYNLMIEELDRANSIITEFLSVAKNKPEGLKDNNLNSIIRALIPLIQSDAVNSSMDFVQDLGDIPNLPLNEKEIRQMLLNLVRNGLEAMDPGGMLTIKTYTEDEVVVLEVRDQGNGIEPHLLEKLGTPFITTKDNGTGLGLAVCYGIASRNNAAVKVNTGPWGTTFQVRFIKK